jgi:5-hydroxyisourate hydrolase
MSQITTHILDTSLGEPASNVEVQLYFQSNNDWKEIGKGKTNSDGRVTSLLDSDETLEAGEYKLRFGIAAYYLSKDTDSFYPFVEIVFRVAAGGQHYHVPLLLNPFGYSTYRGS